MYRPKEILPPSFRVDYRNEISSKYVEWTFANEIWWTEVGLYDLSDIVHLMNSEQRKDNNIKWGCGRRS
jgi:hypothetical protein